MAYVQPQYPPPASDTRSRASSTASGRYVPPGYQVSHRQTTSASLIPEVGSMSSTPTYNPPRPEVYQSNATYQAPISQLQPPQPDPSLPLEDHLRPSSRRTPSDRPRLSADLQHGSDSARSRRSYQSARSHHDDPDRGRKSHDGHRRHETSTGDRGSIRSKRSRRSHHSLRNHFDDDVGRDPEPEPLKRRDTKYPTLGGSLISLWNSMKKSLDK